MEPSNSRPGGVWSQQRPAAAATVSMRRTSDNNKRNDRVYLTEGPTQLDVLCFGRSSRRQWPGNRRYAELLAKAQALFQRCGTNRQHQQRVAECLLEKLVREGRRFVGQESPYYYQMSRKEASLQIWQALRTPVQVLDLTDPETRQPAAARQTTASSITASQSWRLQREESNSSQRGSSAVIAPPPPSQAPLRQTSRPQNTPTATGPTTQPQQPNNSRVVHKWDTTATTVRNGSHTQGRVRTPAPLPSPVLPVRPTTQPALVTPNPSPTLPPRNKTVWQPTHHTQIQSTPPTSTSGGQTREANWSMTRAVSNSSQPPSTGRVTTTVPPHHPPTAASDGEPQWTTRRAISNSSQSAGFPKAPSPLNVHMHVHAGRTPVPPNPPLAAARPTQSAPSTQPPRQGETNVITQRVNSNTKRSTVPPLARPLAPATTPMHASVATTSQPTVPYHKPTTPKSIASNTVPHKAPVMPPSISADPSTLYTLLSGPDWSDQDVDTLKRLREPLVDFPLGSLPLAVVSSSFGVTGPDLSEASLDKATLVMLREPITDFSLDQIPVATDIWQPLPLTTRRVSACGPPAVAMVVAGPPI